MEQETSLFEFGLVCNRKFPFLVYHMKFMTKEGSKTVHIADHTNVDTATPLLSRRSHIDHVNNSNWLKESKKKYLSPPQILPNMRDIVVYGD